MITWEVVRDASVNSFDVSEGVLQAIERLLIEAGEIWSRHLEAPNDVTITISLGFIERDDTFLAFGGGGFSSIGTTAGGQNLVQIEALREIATGVDTSPGSADLNVTINFANLSQIFLDNDTSTDDVPANLSDGLTLFVHEIGHGLGFASALATANEISSASTIDTFAQFVILDGDRFVFNGPNAVEQFGGNVPLVSPEDFIHLGAQNDPLQPMLIAGVRVPLSPLNIAILEDLGAVAREASDDADELFGFGRFSDVLDGLAGDDTLFGLGANDTLRGGEGNDALIGGNGIDFIRGGTGDDVATGGNGNDQIFGGPDDVGADIFIGGSGNDTIGGRGGDDLLIGGGTNLALDLDLDLVDLDGGDPKSDGGDTIFGGEGNDTLLAGGLDDANANGRYDAGEEVLSGTAANTLYSGPGADLVLGAAGNDTIGGGDGDDTLRGGDGDDTFFGGVGDVNGPGLNDVIEAGGGNDTVFAGAGNDSIDGGSGNDQLFNGGGTDTVIGGAGNDTLFGGTGDDILSGNSGADTFAFFNGNGNDTVLDFNLNDDILDLSGTETDFTDLASVEAAASNAVQNGTSGLLINIGDGESIFITGLSTDNLDSINIIF